MLFDRRGFLVWGLGSSAGFLLDSFWESADSRFNELKKISARNGWQDLGLGDRIVAAGREFLGVPYVGGTLEGNPEQCKVFTDKLDCVTFLEISWAAARCSPDITEDRIKSAVIQTRYRGARVNGYWSRLHYTTDFLETHRRAGKLLLVSEKFAGRVQWNPDTSYMSRHPKSYAASKYVKDFASGALQMEEALRDVRFARVPVDRWGENLKLMKPGDLLSFCTTKEGLDFSHVGIYSGDGKFLHASSSARKVVEQDLLSWGAGIRTCNGMVVGRAQPFPLA